MIEIRDQLKVGDLLWITGGGYDFSGEVEGVDSHAVDIPNNSFRTEHDIKQDRIFRILQGGKWITLERIPEPLTEKEYDEAIFTGKQVREAYSMFFTVDWDDALMHENFLATTLRSMKPEDK